MTLTPDDESLILSGRRLVPDECGDAFFDFVAAELRKNDGTPVFGIVRNAVQAFRRAPRQCPGCG